jgi:hypothetical protein
MKLENRIYSEREGSRLVGTGFSPYNNLSTLMAFRP